MGATSRPLDALQVAYGDLQRLIGALAPEDFARRTRCVGWCVRDLVFHLLLDGHRALVAMTTQSDAAPDTDAVTYWRSDDDGPTAADAEDAHARFVRVSAAALGTAGLVALHHDTTAAVQRAVAAADVSASVDDTEGQRLTVPDFVATLVVEAAVHHLDLIVDLAGAPLPGPRALAVVRTTFDGLLGGSPPDAWDDVTYALTGAGRVPLAAADRRRLGGLADRLPLL